MIVARSTTILFGLGTIGVAFLVPLAGGIVEVVLSIAAVTGGALYGPAIWALFSKKQTGKTILAVTLISLIINVFFKFITPKVFGIALDRTEELLLGVGIPFILLVLVEIISKPVISLEKQTELQASIEFKELEESKQNDFGIKVLGVSLMVIGLLFGLLSIKAVGSEYYLIGIGALIFGIGIMLFRSVLKPKIKTRLKTF